MQRILLSSTKKLNSEAVKVFRVRQAVFSSVKDEKPAIPTVSTLPAPPQALSLSYFKDISIIGVSSFLAVSTLSTLFYAGGESQNTLVLGSFGASVVLLYCAPKVPFSQPYNVVCGHLIGAGCGTLSNIYLSSHPASLAMVSALTGVECITANHILAAPVAVSLACMGMSMTKSIHPPAGGTTLACAIGSPLLTTMGLEIMTPTLVGSTGLVAGAVVLHRIVHGSGFYPQRWGP